MDDTGVVSGPASGQTGHTHRFRGLVVTGFIATLAAVVVTTLAAALAQAVGVDFEIPDGGETIPLSGFAVVTGFFSVVGVVMAAALLRWSARPAERFLRAAVPLTAISLIPPLLSGADTEKYLELQIDRIVPLANTDAEQKRLREAFKLDSDYDVDAVERKPRTDLYPMSRPEVRCSP